MKKALIWGSGFTGQKIYKEAKDDVEVLGFLDSDQSRWGMEPDGGFPFVLGGMSILESLSYDEIIIGTLTGFKVIRNQLLEAGIPAEKINTGYIETQINARIHFLHDFAGLNNETAKQYAVAEGGVFQGEFAKEINAAFPESTLYLFDTFEGFDRRDVDVEAKEGYSNEGANHLSITSEDLVLHKLPYREKAIIRKGYFPETAKGLEDTTYFFVNLDFDLYQPILEGLRFFIPRLAPGGILLVHDFFSPGYFGTAKAVSDFEKESNLKLHKFPIGDHCSLGIMVC